MNLERGDVCELLAKYNLSARNFIGWGVDKRYPVNAVNISDMRNETIIDIAYNMHEMCIITDKAAYYLVHDQSCCEDVYLQDIVGDVEDLIGKEVLMAEESTNDETPLNESDAKYGAFLWTYYKLASIKGYVDIRWYGTSNGYYSEDVTVYKINHIDVSDNYEI